jgi:hypothetical protein
MDDQIKTKRHLKIILEWIDGISIVMADDGNAKLNGSIFDQTAL